MIDLFKILWKAYTCTDCYQFYFNCLWVRQINHTLCANRNYIRYMLSLIQYYIIIDNFALETPKKKHNY